jgi:hypothetical protein
MDNGDGTVTDCKTGMIWMGNANCFGLKNWDDARSSCSALASGSCDLYDGSSAGDWHLPTIEELKTLPDRTYILPALSNSNGDGQWTEGDAFRGVQLVYYWSATTNSNDTLRAWGTAFTYGYVNRLLTKTNSNNVWCVRRGQ